MKLALIAGGLFAAALATSAVAQTQTQIVSEDIMVKSPDAGIELFVRNKRPANMTSFRPERTRASTSTARPIRPPPPSTSSSTACPGWITSRRAATTSTCLTCAATASRRGRRRCPRTPKANPPIVRGDVAVKDIGTVGRFHARAPQHPARQPARLVVGHGADGDLHDAEHRQGRAAGALRAVWIRQTPSLVQTGPGPTPAYRTVARDQALGRWLTGVPEDKKATLIPAGWFDAWADATWATDPGRREDEPAGAARAKRRGAGRPRVLRRRQGLLRSVQDHACRPCWSSASGTATRRPTWRRRCFRCSSTRPASVSSMLAEGTHTIVMEKNRHEAVRGGASLPRRGGRVVGSSRFTSPACGER